MLTVVSLSIPLPLSLSVCDCGRLFYVIHADRGGNTATGQAGNLASGLELFFTIEYPR